MSEQSDPTPARGRRNRPATGPAASEPVAAEAAPKTDMTPALETAMTATPAPVVASSEAPAAKPATPRFNLSRGSVGEVEADTVTVDRGAIGAASAEDVTVSMGAIGQARADDIAVRMGAVGLARSERLSVELGTVTSALTGDLSIRQGFARNVIARDASFELAGAQTVVANSVRFGPRSGALVVIARRVEGEVRPLLDWRGALAAGAVIGLIAGIASRRRQG